MCLPFSVYVNTIVFYISKSIDSMLSVFLTHIKHYTIIFSFIPLIIIFLKTKEIGV